MTREQQVRLWDAINAVVAASGGSVSNTSVARQKAVVAVEREIETIEIRYAAPPWLSDVAEALGLVRPEDGAPLALNWNQALEEIRDLLDDRDHWKRRAEQAEFSLGACRDECAALRQCEAILAEQACPDGGLR